MKSIPRVKKLQIYCHRSKHLDLKFLWSKCKSEFFLEESNFKCLLYNMFSNIGDVRAREMPGLASMHTLFLREHNRIALKFNDIVDTAMPDRDEHIYQMTRRIVIAEMQNIVYNEYLPAIIGNEISSSFDLLLPATGFCEYKSDVNPNIANVFATASYRFGHSMISGLVSMLGVMHNNIMSTYKLGSVFFNTTRVDSHNGLGFDMIINGLINQVSPACDLSVDGELTHNLFQGEDNFGQDLVARNIQRGRDHGLPGYNDWREFVGLPRIQSWSDYQDEMSPDALDVMSEIYESVDDIDLFSGALSEYPAEGSVMGKTFATLNAMQFEHLKNGDRFFFCNGGQPGSFSEDQLDNIRLMTLADVICHNTGIMMTKHNVFKMDSENRDCTEANDVDVSLFSV